MTRTILFDVDHTLLYTGGAGGLAMARAFHQLHGIQNAFRNIEGTGRTDWSILKRGLQAHDLFDETADFNDTVANFIDAYVDHLATTLREPPEGYVEPGIPELLDALAARDDVRLGLATGNFRRACLLKLEYYELNGHLSEGGFGDDAEDRGDMVGRAIQRLASSPSANGDTPSKPDQIWIVGDTPRDVEAARANNVRCLAVATGDSTVDELRAAGADVALKDLSNTEEVLSALFG
ncbi:MAG: HAD hydrolase-like protein [Chloroflexi bacterium]|nr:HAD hydrolase-like protein [Chloroflexota bacterium]